MSVEAETVTTNVRLPPDVWQLLFDELASRYDYLSTLLLLLFVFHWMLLYCIQQR